jgi:hypothetical protein
VLDGSRDALPSVLDVPHQEGIEQMGFGHEASPHDSRNRAPAILPHTHGRVQDRHSLESIARRSVW